MPPFDAHALYPRFKKWCLIILLLWATLPAWGYVGPGAGFAFVSSFFTLFLAFILSFITILTWPVRFLVRAVLRLKNLGKARVKRVVIVGLDGQDPGLTEDFMAQGHLPNFKKLQDIGGFYRLGTSLPAESPVAWSSFQTGCNPGKHRIYDFLVPNRQALLPELSSAAVSTPGRTINIGKYSIPLGKAKVKAGRKSRPFWLELSKYGIFSSILRVPITFPPEKFYGVLLSGMCVPDLKGSQGTYFYYTTDPEDRRVLKSGQQMPFQWEDGKAKGALSGPENPLSRHKEELTIPFHIVPRNKREADLVLDKKTYRLQVGIYTPWIQVAYRAGLGVKVRGICMFYLLATEPHVRLYVPPIQIDPEKPALPVSHPFSYAVYLAKRQGPFATLGVAEDTSALNEHIIDEKAFWDQCQIIHRERESMFFDVLQKTPRGTVTCVFDITDRAQHMFYRYFDPNEPQTPELEQEKYENRQVMIRLYRQMDELVGRIMQKMDKDTLLMVMSDHGFKPFKREVNLNAWLREHGFLFTKPGAEDADMLQAIDWPQTRAYAMGFGGIYINMRGREKHGIVAAGEESESLKKEISKKLEALLDPETQEHPVKTVYDRYKAYSGPYVEEAPDLIAGFKVGYRAAWASVTGGMGTCVIQENPKPWGGDHNMNPPDVPGMLFCNKPINRNNPHLVDIGPTVLDLFGVPIPAYCDGESLMPMDKEPPSC